MVQPHLTHGRLRLQVGTRVPPSPPCFNSPDACAFHFLDFELPRVGSAQEAGVRGVDSGHSEGPGAHISFAWCWVMCRVGRSEGGEGLWFSSTSNGSGMQRGLEGIHLPQSGQLAAKLQGCVGRLWEERGSGVGISFGGWVSLWKETGVVSLHLYL